MPCSDHATLTPANRARLATVPFPISLPPLSLNPVTTSILLAAVIAVFFLGRKNSKLPHANPPAWYAPKIINQLHSMQNGIKILEDGRKRFPNQPFRIIQNTREVIVFPERFANTFRNEEGLSFAAVSIQDFHSNTPEFTPIKIIEHQGQVLQNVTQKPLTKLLNTITKPLASKAIFAINHILGHPTDSMLDFIARLSLRFLVAIFSKQCRAVRGQLRRAQELIRPVIEERRLLKEQARKEGKLILKFNDAIEWGDQECKGISYDPASLQLLLSVATIYTTSDLLLKLLILLAREPELIEPLREEIITSKNSLFNIKLVDSAIKEAQRLMPIKHLSMRRIATKDVHVAESNITIRKGEYVTVEDTHGASLPAGEDIQKFDIYQTPEFANKAHFVSTSPEHLGFGHRTHACPSRFFAANEIKIALCFLLLQYDWELAPGTTADLNHFGLSCLVDPNSTLRYRKREAEIDLEALKFE
ncbi:cytochrome P450 monooxygenase-like protein [Bipolaris maydis]|nr:cytochrome P450 monooxygenase-like protein [Bipolaris maydis]